MRIFPVSRELSHVHLLSQNTALIFKKRLTIHGFIVPDLIPKYAGRFFTEIPALLAQGKIIGEESVIEGIENAPQAIVDMLTGGRGADVGKPVIIVAKA